MWANQENKAIVQQQNESSGAGGQDLVEWLWGYFINT